MTNFKKTGPTGNRQPVAPPRWARHFLEWYCRPELMEDLQGDLNEYFERNLKTKGTTKAKLIYVIDVFKFLRPYTIKKIQLSEAMYDLIVFQNYFKTSLRNIARNKLFSAINIAGLAIAMSVGLLLIALITELRSFDSFHKNAARIYRVNNILDGYNYATTSVLTWRKIKETVSGIDQVTIVRRGLYEDLHYQDKVVPLRGLWADENFFRIFSFDLISGNAATALKEPNAIVLTRSSALKLFGETDVAGKLVQIDSTNYAVTGVVNDPPLNSHMRFEMLCSFISIDAQKLAEQNREWMQWNFMWANYVYVLLPEENDRLRVEKSLAQISEDGNKTIGNSRIDLYLEPLHEIALARNISNSLGPTVERSAITTLGVFALVVILFACFNYTNLSIARALRRTREVGIRKVVGASRRQVFIQFVFESVILSMLALAFSFGFFILLRGEFVSMNRAFSEMVTLKPTAEIYAYFLGLALLVGILAGLFPAVLFSKINAARVLKDLSSVKLFGHVNLRKGLIVFQYTLSILFIVAVSIGYKQYKYSIGFDLGFKTENILTVRLLHNKPAPLIKELSELPEVKQIAQANHVSSIGTNISRYVRYKDPVDSARIYFNFVDPEYISLHEHKLIAGKTFKPMLSENEEESEVIINQNTVKWMQLPDPDMAIGEEIIIEGKKLNVIGVIEDFHHERVNYPIQNFAFRNSPKQFEVLIVKIQSTDRLATLDKIQAAWKKVDTTHPLTARFFEEHIRQAYDKLSWIIRVVGFIAFLAIGIASMGLLGMVIFTTETRLKEISIRKVMGASEGNLVFLMSRGFIIMLVAASVIAIPCGYLFADQVIFGKIVYRAPITLTDLLSGTFVVMGIAFVMIVSQTVKVARSNPSEVLKNE